MAVRTATAEWKGPLREGTGSIASASGALEGAYSFESRFKDGSGTNPEELVAAAHAGCFSMVLAGVLEQSDVAPDSVKTEAKVQVLKVDDGFAITKIDLVTRVRAEGLDDQKLQEFAQVAKSQCPVSRALAAVSEINVDASLES